MTPRSRLPYEVRFACAIFTTGSALSSWLGAGNSPSRSFRATSVDGTQGAVPAALQRTTGAHQALVNAMKSTLLNHGTSAR